MDMLSENMKIIRNAKGITQTELAKLLGIKRGYIALLETKKKTPSIKFASRLAEALGVPIKELFEEPIQR